MATVLTPAVPASADAGSLTFIAFYKDGKVGIDGLDGIRGATLSPDGKHVYAASELDNSVAVFSRDAVSGGLTFVEALFTTTPGVQGLVGGAAVSVSPDGKHVYVTGAFDNSVAVFSRNSTTGKLSFVQALFDGVAGVDGLEGARGLEVSSDGKNVYVGGEWDQAIAVFTRNATTGALTFDTAHFDGVAGVDGLQRIHHITSSPDGKTVYVAGKTEGAVSAFTRNTTTGALTFLEVHKDGLAGVEGLGLAHAVAVSGDGKQVYATGLDDDAVVVFSRNATTGRLNFVEVHRNGVGGVNGLNGAAGVTVSADGDQVFVTGFLGVNELFGTLAVFNRNATNGTLTFLEFHQDGVGGVNGLKEAATVEESPDGKHVYVAAFNDDAISAFSRGLVVVPPKDGQVGLVDPSTGQWHLRNSAGVVTSFFYGNPGDFPLMGDWDCNGTDTPGMYRQSDGFVYVRNSNSVGIADSQFFLGNPGDVPLAGDFNRDGCDTVSIYRPSEQKFYIANTLAANNAGIVADFSFGFGNPGDKPVTGDWDHDGVTEIGLHRESTGFFYWRNLLSTGIASDEIFFGDPGDRFVAGDWGIVNGIDTPAIFRPGDITFYFRHTLTQGNADSIIPWAGAGSNWVPVAGDFGLG